MGFSQWLADTVGAFGSNPAAFVTGSAGTILSRSGNAETPVRLLGEAVYLDAYRLGHITEEQLYRYMAELGFSENQTKVAYRTAKTHLSAIEASTKRIAEVYETVLDNQDLDNPANLDKTDFVKHEERYCKAMYKLGYDRAEASKLFKTLRPIPTFSILLEWLAKEAFEPTVIEKFGLEDDYPQIFNEIMIGLGVPENEAKKYWIAHWNVPSLGQIGRMFQRFRSDRTDRNDSVRLGAGATWEDLNMTLEDFEEACKLWEIPPYWVKKIIAESYQPLTFTSLQQGYAYGLKPDAWFKGRLLDYGYAPGDADFQLSIWRRKYFYTAKNTRSENLIYQLESGLMTKAEVKAKLVERGVPATDADYMVNFTEERYLLKKETIALQAVKRRYQKENLTDTQLVTMLTPQFPEANRRSRAIDIVKSSEPGAFVRYSIRDISRGLKDNKITPADARAKLDSLRLLDDDIDLILQLYEYTAPPEP